MSGVHKLKQRSVQCAWAGYLWLRIAQYNKWAEFTIISTVVTIFSNPCSFKFRYSYYVYGSSALAYVLLLVCVCMELMARIVVYTGSHPFIQGLGVQALVPSHQSIVHRQPDVCMRVRDVNGWLYAFYSTGVV